VQHSQPRRKSCRQPLTTIGNVLANLDADLIEAHRAGVLSTAQVHRLLAAIRVELRAPEAAT
jgi:hypothetical protein